MKTYHHFAAWAMQQPWAITPTMLQTVRGILAERIAGDIPDADEVTRRVAASRELQAAGARQGGGMVGSVAVLPVYGVLMQHANLMTEMSGGTSTDSVARALRALVADPAVGTIIMDFDSPGGGVYGVAELSDEIYRARATKRVVAVANSSADSAAYWVASAASEVVVTPGGEVGSIGVYMLHEDWSGAYELAGVKPTLVKYGENKGEGLDAMPLDATALEHFQKRVNQYGEMFTDAVARNRGVPRSVVLRDFGQGMVFGAHDAVRLGLADRVETLDETIARYTGARPARGASALADGAVPDVQLVAEEVVSVGDMAARERERAWLDLAR